MKKISMEVIQILQVVFAGFALVLGIITTVLVWQIGQRQNDINQEALLNADFAEVFLMPQAIVSRDQSVPEPIGWNILIRNASAYPIYLNGYTLNGVKQTVGSSALPADSDSWYTVPVPQDIQQKGMFSLLIDFEDYRGKKYRTEGFGVWSGSSWGINSKKRVLIE